VKRAPSSPPKLGGVAAPLIKCFRSLMAQTGWLFLCRNAEASTSRSGTTPARQPARWRAPPPNLGGELLPLMVVCILIAICPHLAFSQGAPDSILTQIGVDQRLNAQLPLDLVFHDESGKDVRLGDYFHSKPVILSLVYYECSMLCSMTLNGLTEAMRALSFDAGKQFEVLTISFEPKDTPAIASAKKASYLKEYGRSGAASGWHFLTGSRESIKSLTNKVGYRYKWDPYTNQWAHVSAIMILTPQGRVSQYLYGLEFSARDVRLSLIEASQNKIGSIVDHIVLYCYHYDPATGKYGLVIMSVVRLAGFGTVFALALFVFKNRRS
jgi:protein SCO1